MTRYLDLTEVLDMVEAGGFVIRDPGLLASAVERPQMSVFGEDAYPTLLLRAGAMTQSLAGNHPLVDGNKRLTWTALRVFLLLNDQTMTYTEDQAVDFVLWVAAEHPAVDEISMRLEQFCPTAAPLPPLRGA